jgi:hypothetical protein
MARAPLNPPLRDGTPLVWCPSPPHNQQTNMKFDIKKYATVAAFVSVSAFMVSCDGDDGKDGSNGAPGADGTVKQLPVKAPAGILLPLATINGVVDNVQDAANPAWSNGDDIVAGDEITINFLSDKFADVTEEGDFDWSSPIAYTIDPADGTKFTVEYQTKGGDPVELKFTVKDSKDYTLLGTFSGGAYPVIDTFSLGALGGDGVVTDNALVVNNAMGTAEGGPKLLTTDSSEAVFTLPEDVIAVTLENDNVYVRTSSGDQQADVDGFAIPEGGDPVIVVDGDVDPEGPQIDATWKQIKVRLDLLPDAYTGTFRLDMNPSQGGLANLANWGLNGGN